MWQNRSRLQDCHFSHVWYWYACKYRAVICRRPVQPMTHLSGGCSQTAFYINGQDWRILSPGISRSIAFSQQLPTPCLIFAHKSKSRLRFLVRFSCLVYRSKMKRNLINLPFEKNREIAFAFIQGFHWYDMRMTVFLQLFMFKRWMTAAISLWLAIC